MLGNTLLLSYREIRRNVMRSALTVLGIVIGVAAVIVIVTLGTGTQDQVASEIAKMGSNMLTLSPSNQRRGGGAAQASIPFDLSDVAAIRRELSDIALIAPVSLRPMQIIYGNKNIRSNVMGTDNNFSPVRNWQVVEGRLFTPNEVRAGKLACIIGSTVRDELFPGQTPVGAAIRIGRTTCNVIGVLESKGQIMFGGDQDEVVVIPIRGFQRRIAGNTNVNQIYLSAVTEDLMEDVKSEVTKIMRERRNLSDGAENNFSIRDMSEISSVMQSTTTVMTGFLSAIAAVSLLVGGIGIMNIMLVSVTERTREIGIRMAIGATEREVLMQFLVEAGMLSGFGGLMGVCLGLGGAAIVSPALGVPFSVQPLTAIGAFLFSALVGIVFGYMPARRAARLDPIEALRHE